MAPNVHQLDPYKVQEITTLGKQEDGKARQLLDQVAKQVQPLMRRHQLRVPLLSEFYPSNPNLLGLNVGGGGGGTSEIRIRLRRAGRELEFYDYTHVLGTMLHELVHNHHGPHNATFYKLLDQYTEECEELMAKGISGSGAGFDAAPAGKVGGRFVGHGDPAPHRKRELALRAAEQRARKQALMPAGPKKLGGDLTLRVTCDPRQAAAIAAERRARDNQWCPAETLAAEAAAGHSVDSAIQHVLNNNPGGAKPTEARAGGAATQQQHDDLPLQVSQQQQQQQQHDDLPLQVPQQQQQQQGGAAAPDQAQPPPGHEQLGMATNGLEPGGAMSQQQQQQHQQQQQAEASGRQEAPGGGGADFIDLTGDEDGAIGPGPAPESAHVRAAAAAAAAAAAPPIKRRKSGGSLDHGAWACQVCTLLNRAMALQCDACGSTRPAGFTG